MNTKIKLLIVSAIAFFVIFANVGTVGTVSAQTFTTTCSGGTTTTTINGFVGLEGSQNASVWFEWGSTQSLGSSTTRQTFYSDSNFSQLIYGLRENSTYYYRAMGSNELGVNETGDIKSFRTVCTPFNPPPVTPRPPVVPTPTPVPPPSLVLVTSSVDRNQPIVPTLDNTNPCPADEINYNIAYHNVGARAITGLTLRIDLPMEVDYMLSNPSNPTRFGNTLIFNLGTLRANAQGAVMVKVRVRDNAPAGANLNFPATLSYVDSSNFPQSVNADVFANVCGGNNGNGLLGANVFGAGFLPSSILGWLLLLILALILVFLARYIFGQPYNNRRATAPVQQ